MHAMSPILYQNQTQTIFLLDIPASIETAQTLFKPNHINPPPPTHHLLSTTPPQTPYNTSTEPKTASARERVLARVPGEETRYHTEVIGPVVSDAIGVIRAEYRGGEWCRPRCVVGARGELGSDRGYSGEDLRLDEDAEGRDLSTAQYDDAAGGGDTGLISGPRSDQPPVILSPTSINGFESTSELANLPVKNTSTETATVRISQNQNHQRTFTVPPLASFVLCTIPTTQMTRTDAPAPIPGLQGKRFNLILLDPPWPNRSARRSRQYQTNAYFDGDSLSRRIGDILRVHLCGDGDGDADQAANQTGIAAIWVTNSTKSRNSAYNALQSAGLCVVEEWAWVKTTTQGEPITPVDGIWRKPYEIFVIGRRAAAGGENAAVDGDAARGGVTRRVIAAVPDVHSRKPNLRELFERVIFTSPSSLGGGSTAAMAYSALEVFARNLTAGWWACGDEAVKFNEQHWWAQPAAR